MESECCVASDNGRLLGGVYVDSDFASEEIPHEAEFF